MTKDFKTTKTTSFLGKGTDLDGSLTVRGGIRIDGKLKGEIHSNSVVLLGESARIKGNIDAEAVISSGQIEGNITSAKHVQISHPGKIKGSIETRELVLEKGVYFDGSCKIIEPGK